MKRIKPWLNSCGPWEKHYRVWKITPRLSFTHTQQQQQACSQSLELSTSKWEPVFVQTRAQGLQGQGHEGGRCKAHTHTLNTLNTAASHADTCGFCSTSCRMGAATVHWLDATTTRQAREPATHNSTQSKLGSLFRITTWPEPERGLAREGSWGENKAGQYINMYHLLSI